MPEPGEVILRDWALGLEVDHVLRGQGADPGSIRARRPRLVELAEWALAEGLPLLEPVVLAREMRVQVLRHERLLLEGGGSLSGRLIAQHLGLAERVTLMVCTVGGQLEQVTAEVLREDPMRGMALDGVGTAAVEALATQAAFRFEQRAREGGLQPSIPLSPGMVGWAADEGQRQIFALLDAGQVGVRLNDSQMMEPVKSLTQVVGFGREMTLQGRTCDFCSLKDTCRYQDHYA